MKLWCDGRHKVSIQAIGFVRSGAHVLSLGIDDELVVSKTLDGVAVQLKPQPRNPQPQSAVEFNFNGRDYFAYAHPKGVVLLVDVETNHEVPLIGHTELVLSLAYCKAKKLLVTGSTDLSMRVWDVATRKEQLLVPHSDAVNCVCVSEDGKYIASGSRSGEVLVWQA